MADHYSLPFSDCVCVLVSLKPSRSLGTDLVVEDGSNVPDLAINLLYYVLVRVFSDHLVSQGNESSVTLDVILLVHVSLFGLLVY